MIIQYWFELISNSCLYNTELQHNDFIPYTLRIKATQIELILTHSPRKDAPSHLELILIGQTFHNDALKLKLFE